MDADSSTTPPSSPSPSQDSAIIGGGGTSDYFNTIVGHIEDIVVAPAFQRLQRDFMEANYQRFDDAADGENRLEYMEIFGEYTRTLESHLVEELSRLAESSERPFDMERFSAELNANRGRLDGEIFELLYSLSDFVAFKELVMDYRAFKAGRFEGLGDGIQVTGLSGMDVD